MPRLVSHPDEVKIISRRFGQGAEEIDKYIELDGYKHVRALEKGPDGVWRGRAMRGRTEIAIRVDATGSVSAD